MSEIAKNIAAGLAFIGLLVLIVCVWEWLMSNYQRTTLVACSVLIGLFLAGYIGGAVREIWRAGK